MNCNEKARRGRRACVCAFGRGLLKLCLAEIGSVEAGSGDVAPAEAGVHDLSSSEVNLSVTQRNQ